MKPKSNDHIKEILDKQNELMGRYGWYAHIVTDCKSMDTEPFNAHTHGLPETFEHPNLQIIYTELSQKEISDIFTEVIDSYVSKGYKLHEGLVLELTKYKTSVKFVPTTSYDNENVIRILLPDGNGKFPGDEGCDEYINQQLTIQVN